MRPKSRAASTTRCGSRMDSLQQWQQLQPLWVALWAPQWRRPRVPRAPVTAARAQPCYSEESPFGSASRSQSLAPSECWF
mmetsp:Transcript_673/g.1777  ORF Transcript_673/g.1777 Transcript_673/m.1777 type:complete len:80 (+) Transcript_673:2285-2524(+)